jgi:hypothetical protein
VGFVEHLAQDAPKRQVTALPLLVGEISRSRLPFDVAVEKGAGEAAQDIEIGRRCLSTGALAQTSKPKDEQTRPCPCSRTQKISPRQLVVSGLLAYPAVITQDQIPSVSYSFHTLRLNNKGHFLHARGVQYIHK